MILETLANMLKYSHVVIGLIGLVVMWIPIFATKGSRNHIRFGRTFEWCCYLVGISGFVSALWWLLLPATRPELLARSKSELSVIYADIQFVFGLLAFLAVVLLSTTRFGVRVVRCRQTPNHLRNAETYFWFTALASTSLLLAVVALAGWSKSGKANWSLVFLAFPLIAGLDIRSKWRFARTPPQTAESLICQHVDCMAGSAITFCTAFLVLGGNRIYGDWLSEPIRIGTFFLPTVVGVVLCNIAKRKIRMERR